MYARYIKSIIYWETKAPQNKNKLQTFFPEFITQQQNFLPYQRFSIRCNLTSPHLNSPNIT